MYRFRHESAVSVILFYLPLAAAILSQFGRIAVYCPGRGKAGGLLEISQASILSIVGLARMPLSASRLLFSQREIYRPEESLLEPERQSVAIIPNTINRIILWIGINIIYII